MERQTSLFLIGVVLSVCFATVLGDIIVAEFVERRDGDDYGYTSGTLYYNFDAANRANSRLRLDYTFDVWNLYDFTDSAMYSMCSDACTGLKFTEGADPWYYDNKFYTKTNEQEGGMYWYTRTDHEVSASVGKQVTRILMNGAGAATSDIKKIDFADGRHLTLSNVRHEQTVSVSFSPDKNLNCPKATCPIYADLIFVLDNSNSVEEDKNHHEWTDTVNFVKDVMDSFTFGSDAVEAAVIQFNGGYYSNNIKIKTGPGKYDYYWSGCNKPDWCNMQDHGACSSDYVYDNYAFPGYGTATIFAGKTLDGGKMTVTSSIDNIKNKLNSRPDHVGDTCQGYGLELAKQVLDNSPRRAYQNKPQAIVIAVTDGEDHCPNKTARTARELREDYGAFVIEIGVGMSDACNNYHQHFLESLASYVGSQDNAAYYPVDDYASIKTVTERLFKPLCSNFSSQCGPDCLGFCGCGKCTCPSCDNGGSSCLNVTCRADGITSTGCVAKVNRCPDDDKCYSYTCNGNKPFDERCEREDKCAQMRAENSQYACREVACDNYEGCHVVYHDSYCKDLFAPNNKCEIFKCATSNADITPGYEESGCQLVSNKTKEKLDELTQNGKISCYKPTCDPSTGFANEIDTCEQTDDLCDPYCTSVGNNQYQCVDFAKGRGDDTVCTQYECKEVNQEKKWVPKTLKSNADCEEEIIHGDPDLQYEYRCFIITCSDAENQCIATKNEVCNDICTPEILANCGKIQEGSSPASCFNVTCDDKNIEGGQFVGKCVESTHIDCLNDPKTVKDLNDNNLAEGTQKCCSIVCTGGECDLDCEDMPNNRNKCVEYRCTEKSQGVWSWELFDSNETTNCFSNECFERKCIPNKGCVDVQEICEVQTNKCYNFTCDKSTFTCVNTSLLLTSTCTKEVCVGGAKKVVEEIDKCDLVNTYQCLEAKCEYDSDTKESQCVYYDKPQPGNDPCTNYTCENSTGKWTETPKCDDGKYCTENVCTIFGECKYPDVTCSELSMENYDCFERRCKEDPANEKYICYRKIIGFVDVCGQCIKEDVFDLVDTSDASYSSSGEYVDNCANGGPRPLLTEGLAAASIALIILAAVVIGAGVAASGVMGTKTLINRAKGAENASAHTNPLFENSDTEMTNPAFAGTAV